MFDNYKIVQYDLTLKKDQQPISIIIPNFKQECYIPYKLEVITTFNGINVSIKTASQNICIDEAYLFISNIFDFSDQQYNICDIDNMILLSKFSREKDKSTPNTLNFIVKIHYKHYIGNCIFRYTYTSLSETSNNNIITDLLKSGNIINKIILSSNVPITRISFEPQYKILPKDDKCKTYDFYPNDKNTIIIEDKYLIDNMMYYNIILSQSIIENNISVLVFGFKQR